MKNTKALSVGIVGGGFCGVMTLVHLVANAKVPIHITLFNKHYPLARGIAYKTHSEQHLLNVEARNMSAFPDDPVHFVKWCEQNNVPPTGTDLPTSYLPRNVYGKYIEAIFKQCISYCPPHVKIEVVDEEVTDADKNENDFIITTAEGHSFTFEKIVLATGNAVPQDPRIKNREFLQSRVYFGNPWSPETVTGVEKENTILIIGTGLTMVDTVISLEENNFRGKIVAMSPHGFKILPHRRQHLQRSILDELSPPYKLEEVFRLFYKHVRQARLNGSSGEAVVDAVRTKTQEIWQHLSLAEKQRFMTHLRHMWGVARHRLPKDVHSRMEAMIDSGRLQVIAGKLVDAATHGNNTTVRIAMRQGSYIDLQVNRIINCTGPQSDIRKQKSPLYKQLLSKKLIAPDPMNLGIDATAEGKIINPNGEVSDCLFALGTLLKGKLWESTAVPELRVQAATTARILLKDLKEVVSASFKD